MNCQVEEYKSYDTPILAGTFRFLVGLLIMLLGAYLAVVSGVKGSGLGFLLILVSPFLIFKDDK